MSKRSNLLLSTCSNADKCTNTNYLSHQKYYVLCNVILLYFTLESTTESESESSSISSSYDDTSDELYTPSTKKYIQSEDSCSDGNAVM